MAFRLHPGRDLSSDIQRVIRRELAAAIASARDSTLPPAERAHRGRVACKRARAAIGLIRSCDVPRWKNETRALRRAARVVAEIRESGVLLATLDALAEQWGDKSDARTVAHLRQRLFARGREARAAAGSNNPLARFATRLHRVESRIAALTLEGGGFDLIASGFEKTYRRARDAFRHASEDRSAAAFHVWRQHAKAHAYQLELLQPAWPDVLGIWTRKVQILGRLLGDERDLTTLQDWLTREWREKADRRNIRDLLELISGRRSELRDDASDLGRRVFAEKPAALCRRMAAWWTAAAESAGDKAS